MPADSAWRRGVRHVPALLAVLLASCAPAALDRAAPDIARLPVAAPVCRVGPDGGPLPPSLETVDRGIGGTGTPVRQADKGIGGTGAPVRQAERGIGGTGIVAVITGFASVCLAGQEVALDPGTPVLVGDRPATQDALRAGQVAVVNAAGPDGALRARTIAVRYEVSGPVEQIDGASLRVAGQQVAVTAGTLGDQPAVGEWMAVSGLRRPDGIIEATRLDRRAAGDIIVHGRLVRAGTLWRIGNLPVRFMPGALAVDGQYVTILGVMNGGVLQAEQLAPDLLASNPVALFGAGVNGLLIETFATLDGGRMRFGQGFSAAAPGLGAVGAGRSVLALKREAEGLRAIGSGAVSATSPALRGGPASVPARQFEPAPVPNRALGLLGRGGRDGEGRAYRPSGRSGVRQVPGGDTRAGYGPENDASPSAGGGPGLGPATGGDSGGGPRRGR